MTSFGKYIWVCVCVCVYSRYNALCLNVLHIMNVCLCVLCEGVYQYLCVCVCKGGAHDWVFRNETQLQFRCAMYGIRVRPRLMQTTSVSDSSTSVLFL